jgi:predicted nucleic acid-binding protein
MMTATIARSAFDALSTLAGEPVTTTSFVLAAFQKSLELNHSVFACLYLETARSLGARFVTLDSRFLDKLRQTADETLALHLSDWRPEAP